MTEQEISQGARASRDSARKESTPTLQDAIWNRLPEVPATAPTPKRWLPALATGAAGVTLAGIVTGTAALWLPGAPLAPAPAFAQVEKAMQEVQNAEWTERTESTVNVQDKKTGRTHSFPFVAQVIHFKVRLNDTPRAVSVEVPNINNSGWRSIDDGQTVFSSHITGLRYEYRSRKSDNQFVAGANATPAERIRSLVLFPRTETATGPATGEQELSSELHDVHITRSPWVSRPDTIEDKNALRWESDWTYTYKNSHTSPQVHHIRIWVNPDTYRVLRREEEYGESLARTTFHLKRVSENYRYNVPLGSENFTITPPPVGMPFGYRDFTNFDRSHKAVNDSEQKQIRAVVMQAVQAWDQHDANAFARLWNFDFDRQQSLVYHGTRLTDSQVRENVRHWRVRAAKGIPYRRWSVDDIRFADQYQSLYVRQSAEEPFPPQAEPNVFAVTVSGQVQLENGTQTPADATVTLHKDKSGMKITYINMYSKPTWRSRAKR